VSANERWEAVAAGSGWAPAERVERIAANVVADAVGVPDRLTQQPLHRLW